MGVPGLHSRGPFLYLSEWANSQQAIRASSLMGGTSGGAKNAQGYACLLPVPENIAREDLLPPAGLSARVQSLSPQVLLKYEQEPRECFHPGSYFSGEVPALAWIIPVGRPPPGPCPLTVLGLPGLQASLPLCLPSARPCLHLLPPPYFQPHTSPLCERPPWCTGSLQTSSGQILLQGHLAW